MYLWTTRETAESREIDVTSRDACANLCTRKDSHKGAVAILFMTMDKV